jgi:hypothetical protein
MGQRVDDLVARLNKGARKTSEFFGALSKERWACVVYASPSPWTLRDLLAHFLSSEVGLLRIAQDIAAGGTGAPDGFDYNQFNADEQLRLTGVPAAELLSQLAEARSRTLAWLSGLADADLDKVGQHPALGQVNLETLVNAVYGHQLMHMRDVPRGGALP